MTRYDLVRPLNPQPGYPQTPLDISVGGIRYDLALPADVADALHDFCSDSGPLHRLHGYSTPLALARLLVPSGAATLEPGYAVFARSESRLDLSHDKMRIGRVVQQFVINSQGASQLFEFALNEEHFAPDIGAWIMNHFRYFHLSGGLELICARYYFTPEELDAVSLATTGVAVCHEPRPTVEAHDRLALFREFLDRTSSASSATPLKQ